MNKKEKNGKEGFSLSFGGYSKAEVNKFIADADAAAAGREEEFRRRLEEYENIAGEEKKKAVDAILRANAAEAAEKKAIASLSDAIGKIEELKKRAAELAEENRKLESLADELRAEAAASDAKRAVAEAERTEAAAKLNDTAASLRACEAESISKGDTIELLRKKLAEKDEVIEGYAAVITKKDLRIAELEEDNMAAASKLRRLSEGNPG